ncbi:MAG: GTPase HflX [Bdellovibrionales bacterium RIFCSPHIGHO2_01_FULL_40_29]|nr:MAG: GTPase HflX [Bdellovibrionales bacterium RIFCSPHIGHO2_01_FULL_40_29]OFZ33593.1 MAG: GTPase HflX [Bdellovibrionales bacterium RIFCSPHIGHO2_02_FULL_40_15]
MSIHSVTKNAVLVGIQLSSVRDEELQSSLQELKRLVTTLGYSVVGQVTQRRSSDKSASVLGEGKLKELAEWTGGPGVIGKLFEKKKSKAALKWDQESDEETAEDLEDEIESIDGEDSENLHELSTQDKKSAQIVIVDTELSPSQLRNLEKAAGVPVLDRTGVIIEIFSRHARTKAARLQVEIARLAYVAPRLRETGGNEDRGGGGVGGKGAGETSLELDKRRIRDRIKELKLELASIGNEHQQRRARREQEISVALVGYTNAGKSSLMRAMTGSEVLVADKLFATLDTTVRPMYPESRPKVLISDTVGFIKKLPHDLVASFKSTLDEALQASLLLFVVDASDPAFRSHLEVTQSVLSEVGATDVPRLMVLNKRDQLSAEDQQKLSVEFPEAIFLSTRNKEDLQALRNRIMSYFESNMVDEDLFIPYTVQGAIGEVRSKLRVLSESYNEMGVILKVRSTPENLEIIRKKFILKK